MCDKYGSLGVDEVERNVGALDRDLADADVVEVLQSTFVGRQKTTATPHRLLCEDLSVTMATMNEDRQALRELAMEAEAAKHGITVEEYKKAADAMHAQGGLKTQQYEKRFNN